MGATLLYKGLFSRPILHRSICPATHMMAMDSWTIRKVHFWIDLAGDYGGSLFRSLRPGIQEFGEDHDFPPVELLMRRSHDPPDRLFVCLAEIRSDPPMRSLLNEFLENLLRDWLKPLARSFLAQMLVLGTIPDLRTFFIVVKYYCKHHTYQHVLDLVFTQMRSLGVKADDAFCRRLMNAVCANFGPDAGYQLLKKLRSSHRNPLSYYDAVVRQFPKKKMVDDAASLLIDVLVDMKQQRVFPDEKLYKYLIKMHSYGGEAFLKAGGIGRQMFAEGIRVGAVSPKPDQDEWEVMGNEPSMLEPPPLPSERSLEQASKL